MDDNSVDVNKNWNVMILIVILLLRQCFHVMRDNPSHHVSMLGGTFGGCNTWKPSKSREAINKMLKMAKKKNDDQPALWVSKGNRWFWGK